jgi:Fe-S-cluster-containing hydrogenase component 2
MSKAKVREEEKTESTCAACALCAAVFPLSLLRQNRTEQNGRKEQENLWRKGASAFDTKASTQSWLQLHTRCTNIPAFQEKRKA